MIQVKTVAAIITNSKKHVLLIQREDRPDMEFSGWWTLPGGLAEPSEKPHLAIRREIIQELGIRLPFEFYSVYEHLHHRLIKGKQAMIEQYIFRANYRKKHILRVSIGQAYGFFRVDELSQLKIAYGFDVVLTSYFEGLADD